MASPLQSARLRRIIAAYTVNRLGTWFGLIALSVAVFDHTHSALAIAGLLFAGQALPAFAVPLVVARVEAAPGRSNLSALYVFEAVTTTALVVLLSHFWLPAILLLVALDGVAALAASALLRAEVARTAREHVYGQLADLALDSGASARPSREEAAHDAERRANAALNVAFSTTFVLGPVIAGAVVAAAGPAAALFVDIASFLLGGALLVDLHSDVEAGEETVGARLRQAWHYIRSESSLRGLLIAEFFALIFIETGGPIEIAFVKGTLHAGDRGLGLLLTAWGAGSVLGSIIFARLVSRPLGALLSAGTLAIAGSYLGLAAAPSLGLACVAGLLGGVGNGMQWPSLISGVQRLTAKDLQGRLMGAVESVGALCLAIGLLLGGTLVAISSTRIAFVIVGIGAALATIGFARLPLGDGPPADLDPPPRDPPSSARDFEESARLRDQPPAPMAAREPSAH